MVTATFADASNQMSGNVLVVDPPGGQMENYISRGPLAESMGEKNLCSTAQHTAVQGYSNNFYKREGL